MSSMSTIFGNDNESNDPNNPQNQQSQKSQTPFLDKFAEDLTQAAKENKLDPIVGRDDEIYRISQILSRRKKNNPIILGDPGVGKTAIVEGIAQRIVNKNVSRVLFKKKIFTLDMTSIIAGTKFRGEFEDRMNKIIKEIESDPNIIVFIDEIHNIIGAGGVSGAMDASNILKPSLARGKLQLIGATTTNEYKQIIEDDGALVRRFHTINVKEPNEESTINILNNLKKRYEDYHLVNYSPEAINACVQLSNRYLTERKLPDKAIDLMDESGSKKHLEKIVVPDSIKEIENKLQETKEYKKQSVNDQEFEEAAKYRDEEEKLEEEIEIKTQEWEESLLNNKFPVGYDDIAKTISFQTGIPIEELSQDKIQKIKEMSNYLKNEIIGQDKAIDSITQVIKRSKTGVSNYNKPIGSFIFMGPTGVGKTMTTKKLAEYLFGSSQDSLIRFDMSEFQEKFNVSRLIGAPPGYVGYKEGGELTESVRNNPYSVILLDEIEKAHPDIFNTLLQVLDEGRLNDSDGNVVDFKNTIIIMTSNVGAKKIEDYGNGVGFNTSGSENNDKKKEKIIKKELKNKFRPEFINRLDDLVLFDQLNKKNIKKIVDIELSNFNKRMYQEDYSFKFTQTAKDLLAEKGYDPNYGVRPLQRVIEQYVENPVADAILDNRLTKGKTRTITRNKKGNKLYIK